MENSVSTQPSDNPMLTPLLLEQHNANQTDLKYGTMKREG